MWGKRKISALLQPWRLTIWLAVLSAPLVLWVGSLLAGVPRPGPVLVLHSYHPGLVWTDELHAGLTATLAAAPERLRIVVEYMDTKRHAEPAYFDQLLALYRYKYRDLPLAAVVTSDDHALRFALENRALLFPQTPIVFCGINSLEQITATRGRLMTNITGVVEAFDIEKTLSTALRFHPQARRLYVINDQTPTGLGNRRELERIRPQFQDRVQMEYLENLSLEELLLQVAGMPSESLILLMTFNRDRRGEVFTYAEVTAELAHHAQVPMYGVRDFYLGRGIVGGYLTSGRSQGETAARLLLEVVRGQAADSLPIVTAGPNQPMFDAALLQRFGIPEHRLPPGSVVINRPRGIYHRYRGYIWTGAAVLATQMLIILGLVLNIHRHRKAEERLRRNEDKYRAIFDNIQDIYYEAAWDGTILEISPSVAAILQYERGDLIGRSIAHLYADPLQRQHLLDELQTSGQVSDYELLFKDRAGEPVFISVTARLMKAAAGDPPTIVGTLRSISQRKLAERELRTQRDFSSGIINGTPLMICGLSADGRVRFMNPAGRAICGYTGDELAGRPLLETLKTGDATAPNPDRLLQRMRAGDVCDLEIKIQTSAGHIRTLIWNSFRRFDDQDALLEIIGFGNDITDRKRAEEAQAELQRRLTHSQKMEALGLLAGGVAHDLNNILSGIVTYPQVLLLQADLDPRVRRSLETLRQSGERAAAVVNDLITVARGFSGQRSRFSLNLVVSEYLESPEHRQLMAHYPRCSVETFLTDNLPPIAGSRPHVVKALMNMVLNGLEAAAETGHNGQVRIVTSHRQHTQPVKAYQEIPPGNYALLSVEDNGPGISPADRERIFEPFYSRKVMGRSGTGLGLTVLWNTMQDHAGFIDLRTGPEGTVFDLYFPVSTSGDGPTVAPSPPGLPRGRGETVLVVDDEEAQRDLAVDLLRRLGYNVAAVADGASAVAYVREGCPDLVVLDMIMPPGMDGYATFAALREVAPRLRAIITSGFMENDAVQAAQRLGAGKFVRKPYGVEELAAAIREELDRPGPSPPCDPPPTAPTTS
jgi:PAS domain S-box-containing protein